MPWPNPFRQSGHNTRHAWGYTFEWTPNHFAEEQMHPLKFSYDVLGEEALKVLDELSPPMTKDLPRNRSRILSLSAQAGLDSAPKRDLYALLKDHSSENKTLAALWKEVNTIPDWVDWDQIARGQDVFYRYGGVALTAVTKSLDSIKPGGEGHVSSIRVRLLHAAVRSRIMILAEEKPEYYNVQEYGVPINNLDSIATIGTFSATLIWLGFPRLGMWLWKQEIIDYIALWRLVAHYLGTPTEFFETPKKAKQIMESILLSEINPTETSKFLANNIILSLQGQAPAYASRDFLNASTRWLNGKDLSDALGIGQPSFYYSALVAGQCIFFMALCYTYRTVPYLDRRKIKALRRIFYAVIVENKTHGLGKETNFDFKYIPNFHTSTVKGEYENSRLQTSGVERRYLRTLILASAFVAVGSWLVLTLAYGALARLL